MPDNPFRKPSPVKATIAAKRPRDANGHFIKSDLLKIAENKSADDEALIDVKVTNPLRRISQILSEIKRKQATTIDFKFTIPLIALPIFMLLAFSLGKGSGAVATCSGTTQTKIGVVYVLKSSDSTKPSITSRVSGLLSFLPFLTPPTASQVTPNRPILIQRDNSALTLLNPQNINLASYQTRQVFATGIFNGCDNSLTLKNADDVQLIP